MKAIRKQINRIMQVLVLVLFANVNAQKETISNGMFVRVYNLNGEKISKGKLFDISDTLLTLEHNSKFNNLDPKKIGYIKTKRSAGHNILIGSAIGTATGAILGAASADPDAWIFGYTAAEGATGFGLAGALGGAAVGGISIAFKNSETFTINGEQQRWIAFKQMINK